jgi:CPA1 family monovalent cation:H+ antiporter
MEAFNVVAALMALAAVFAWLNHRYLKLPTTIGLLVISMVFSLALVMLGAAGVRFQGLRDLLLTLDFDEALLHGMLGALLFAGALHVNLDDLAEQGWVILLLATVGVVTSTALVGLGSWWLLGALGVGLPLIFCLLLGALISPTDPIAVGSILRDLGAPPRLMTTITGESLFNDGVGVVLFLVLLGIATGGHGSEATVTGVLQLLVVEVGGGVVWGAALGIVAYGMLKSVDNYQVEIMVTLALVTAGYAMAGQLHISGPLAMVVAGLLIGNHGRRLAMSERTRERLDGFWELVDELLNALLFVMIGVEVLVLAFSVPAVVAGIMMIPLTLLARWIAVSIPLSALRGRHGLPRRAAEILTWSGLRGGISVALALSLPAGPERDLPLTITYVVVAFSIVVQGLSVETVVRRLVEEEPAEA